MFSRVKNVFYNVVGSSDIEGVYEGAKEPHEPKFLYMRPHFLGLNSVEEIKASADHRMRPIIVPRDANALPWNTGYAECINAGKSIWNEDQAVIQVQTLHKVHMVSGVAKTIDIPYVYFGIFDGHAGVGAALAASNQLHHILQEKLVDILDCLIPDASMPSPKVSKETLITGALETAFLEMDQILESDRDKYEQAGGCTALVMLLILGQLYVANAGDSRAMCCMYSKDEIIQLSNDFTPETERSRIRQLAALKPELLGNEFTARDYIKRPTRQELGKRILFKDPFMHGWAYKTLTLSDLKMAVVTGEGKRSRVMGTIGVTRGFGDHDLKAMNTKINVKPFLSAQPEVKIINLDQYNLTQEDVVVLGTDGLWDVTSCEQVFETVLNSLLQFPNEKHRYMTAAQALVAHARGKLTSEWAWRMTDAKAATIDDISVFVIPLSTYYKSHLSWFEEFSSSVLVR